MHRITSSVMFLGSLQVSGLPTLYLLYQATRPKLLYQQAIDCYISLTFTQLQLLTFNQLQIVSLPDSRCLPLLYIQLYLFLYLLLNSACLFLSVTRVCLFIPQGITCLLLFRFHSAPVVCLFISQGITCLLLFRFHSAPVVCLFISLGITCLFLSQFHWSSFHPVPVISLTEILYPPTLFSSPLSAPIFIPSLFLTWFYSPSTLSHTLCLKILSLSCIHRLVLTFSLSLFTSSLSLDVLFLFSSLFFTPYYHSFPLSTSPIQSIPIFNYYL